MNTFKKPNFICCLVLFCLLACTIPLSSATGKQPLFTLDIEGGDIFPGYNDVRIPNTGGTLFSIKNDLDLKGKAYYRLRLTTRLGERHAISLLYAPLSLTADGVLGKTIDFTDSTFTAGTAVDARYTFNSYRLTYRYLLVRKPKISLWIGFTAKIRDAEIRLTSAQQDALSDNVGFVPLLHLFLDWKWGPKVGMTLEADALAAKQGRAEDVAAAIYYKTGKNLGFKIGYRFVEGGADASEVYTFAMINYLFGGMWISF